MAIVCVARLMISYGRNEKIYFVIICVCKHELKWNKNKKDRSEEKKKRLALQNNYIYCA